MRLLHFKSIIILISLIVVLFHYQVGSAQSNINLTGTVTSSESGAPIEGATVSVEPSGFKTATDAGGQYRFEMIPAGDYYLLVSAIGYETGNAEAVEIVPGQTTVIDFKLDNKIYYIGKIRVEDKRQKLTSDKVDLIFRDDIETSGAASLTELLDRVNGLMIQQNGASGPAQVKIRGSSSDHVLVLIDGQKINPSGNGTADLNTIPLAMVERVEIHKGGASAEFGPDAIGGVINIITRASAVSHRTNLNGGFNFGSWNTRQYDMMLRDIVTSDIFSGRLAFTRKSTDGDFDYAYAVSPDPVTYEGTRINNRRESYNYFGSGVIQFDNGLKINYSGQWYSAEQGLPGPATAQVNSASSTDERRLFGSTTSYRAKSNLMLKLDLSFSRYCQLFIDTLSTIKYNNSFTNDIFTIKQTQTLDIHETNQLRAGTELRRDILYHDDYISPNFAMGKSVRDNIALFIRDEQTIDLSRLKIINEAAIDMALRYDYSKTRKDSTSWQDTVRTNSTDFISPKIGLALSGGDNWSYTIRASYGKSFRLPTLNALFWKGDVRSRGNPGLRPEKSEHSEAGFELSGSLGPVAVSGGMTYFHNYVNDLIIWTTSLGAWQPVNMEKARITGHEDYFEISFFDDLVAFEYQNTITTALNKSSSDHTVYNKRLVFTPHYLTSLTARLNWKNLTAAYTVNLSDSAYTLVYNTRYYDSYRLDNLTIGGRYDFDEMWHLRADLKIFNIKDESTVLLARYPMPGRDVRFGLRLIYGITNN